MSGPLPALSSSGRALNDTRSLAQPSLNLPSLGELRVAEMLGILVEHHGFRLEAAVSAVTIGMFVAGYPIHHDRVSAADGFDIVEAALRER